MSISLSGLVSSLSAADVTPSIKNNLQQAEQSQAQQRARLQARSQRVFGRDNNQLLRANRQSRQSEVTRLLASTRNFAHEQKSVLTGETRTYFGFDFDMSFRLFSHMFGQQSSQLDDFLARAGRLRAEAAQKAENTERYRRLAQGRQADTNAQTFRKQLKETLAKRLAQVRRSTAIYQAKLEYTPLPSIGARASPSSALATVGSFSSAAHVAAVKSVALMGAGHQPTLAELLFQDQQNLPELVRLKLSGYGDANKPAAGRLIDATGATLAPDSVLELTRQQLQQTRYDPMISDAPEHGNWDAATFDQIALVTIDDRNQDQRHSANEPVGLHQSVSIIRGPAPDIATRHGTYRVRYRVYLEQHLQFDRVEAKFLTTGTDSLAGALASQQGKMTARELGSDPTYLDPLTASSPIAPSDPFLFSSDRKIADGLDLKFEFATPSVVYLNGGFFRFY